MDHALIPRLLVVLFILNLGFCADKATLPEEAGFGPHPTLPAPNPTLFPTVNIVPAKNWSPGTTPKAAPGLSVGVFAANLDHPRWLYVLPNGDVLVAETNAPPKPEDDKGIKGWIMKLLMKRAGAGVPSANRITLLRDADGDGIAETVVSAEGDRVSVMRTKASMKRSSLVAGVPGDEAMSWTVAPIRLRPSASTAR